MNLGAHNSVHCWVISLSSETPSTGCYPHSLKPTLLSLTLQPLAGITAGGWPMLLPAPCRGPQAPHIHMGMS